MNQSEQVSKFIERWQGITASELATAQSFTTELCELLGVAKPHPTPEQDYMFERPVTFAHGDGSTSAGRIDCYRRGHFVLEAKKLKAAGHTKGFDDALLRARAQAEGYARALPVAEGRPPFLMVVGIVWIRSRSKLEEKRLGATASLSAEKAAQYASHTQALEDRVRVLERIVTDKGYDVATQIEALRDARRTEALIDSRETEVRP